MRSFSCIYNFCSYIPVRFAVYQPFQPIYMNTNDLTTTLSRSLQSIGELLSSLSANDWQRPQVGGKWTIAQEFEHVRLSTQSTAYVLSAAGRSRWHPYNGESRSFEMLVNQYQTALKATGSVNNAATYPTEASAQLTIGQQVDNWNKVTRELITVIGELPETDVDAYTVWKHPLLGPLTVREMVCFTAHHTDHHHAGMIRKRTNHQSN